MHWVGLLENVSCSPNELDIFREVGNPVKPYEIY
jgi:hypothetical protein